MEKIKVEGKKLHIARKAFITLYGREPEILTCNRFDDDQGEPVFGCCKVVSIGKFKICFEADGSIYSAFSKKIEYFWFS